MCLKFNPSTPYYRVEPRISVTYAVASLRFFNDPDHLFPCQQDRAGHKQQPIQRCVGKHEIQDIGITQRDCCRGGGARAHEPNGIDNRERHPIAGPEPPCRKPEDDKQSGEHEPDSSNKQIVFWVHSLINIICLGFSVQANRLHHLGQNLFEPFITPFKQQRARAIMLRLRDRNFPLVHFFEAM